MAHSALYGRLDEAKLMPTSVTLLLLTLALLLLLIALAG